MRMATVLRASYLVVPRVVEDVVAALVHDAGPRDGGAGARRGR